MENAELTHHGIKGMKWYVRRYQNKDGSLTAAGRKRYNKELEDAADYEERKARAVKSGSASEVLKFKGDLTQAEMKAAYDRIKWEQDMAGLSAKEVSAGKARSDKFFNSLENATAKVNTAAKAYNTFANIYNAFSKKDISLPKIDTNITSGNKAERRKEQKEARKFEEAMKKRAEQEAQKETKHQERAEKRARKEAEQAAKQEAKQREKRKPPEPETETVYEGTVSGKGKSKGSFDNWKDKSTVVDVDYSDIEDTPVSNLPAVVVNSGRSYVAGLLEEGN